MAVLGRLRVGDWISLVGLSLLLAWSPSYMASDPTERALLDGESFGASAVRDGDHLALELVVTSADGTALTSGPIINVTYRSPTKTDEAPEGTVLVEEQVQHTANLRLGPWEFQQDYQRVRFFFNTTGWMIGATLSLTEAPADAWLPHLVSDWSNFAVLHEGEGLMPTPPGELFMQPMLAGDRPSVQYASASRLAAFVDNLKADLGGYEQDLEPPPPEGAPISMRLWHTPHVANETTSPLAVRSGPLALYAHRVGYVLWGPPTLYTDHEPWTTPMAAIRLGESWRTGLEIEVGLAEHISVSGPARVWQWAHPDFPVPVGFHGGIYNLTTGEEDWSLDLVPADMRRGDEAFGWTRNRETPPFTPTTPPTPPGSIRLRDIGNDTTAWWDGNSLRGIGEALGGPHAPDTVRQFMSNGGWIGGFAMAVPGGPVYDENFTDSDWAVLLLDDDGRVMVATLAYRGGSDGVPVMEDVCHRPRDKPAFVSSSYLQVDCSPLPPGLAIGSGNVLPASQLLEAALAAGPVEQALGQETPFRTARFLPGLRNVEGGYHATPLELHDWPTEFGFGPALDVSLANEQLQASASIAIQDGEVYAANLKTRAPADYAARELQPFHGTPIAPLETINAINPALAVGGAAILVIGIMARLSAAAKSGVLLPFLSTLYARVARDDALNNQRRRNLLRIVEHDPGLTVTDAARRAGVHRTVAFHHLEMLRRNGIVTEIRLGRSRHYCPAGTGTRQERLRLAALRREPWGAYVRAVESHPGLTVTELAEATGSGKASASKSVRQLTELGVLERRAEGRVVCLFPGAAHDKRV